MLVKQTLNKGYLCTLDTTSEEDSKFLYNLTEVIATFNVEEFYTGVSARVKTESHNDPTQKDVYLFYYKEGNLL